MSDGIRKRLIGVIAAAFLTGIAGLGCHAGKNRPIPFTPPSAEVPSSNVATLKPALRSGHQEQAHQVKKSA